MPLNSQALIMCPPAAWEKMDTAKLCSRDVPVQGGRRGREVGETREELGEQRGRFTG